jgi:hypothetical protein
MTSRNQLTETFGECSHPGQETPSKRGENLWRAKNSLALLVLPLTIELSGSLRFLFWMSITIE